VSYTTKETNLQTIAVKKLKQCYKQTICRIVDCLKHLENKIFCL